jgi:hypothetical protein
VAEVIVGHSFNVAQPHRKHPLGPLQRLHLALFVYAQHQRIVGRIEVQAHDVVHFLHENGWMESLKLLARCGCRPNSAKWRPTVLLEMPLA